MACFSQLYLGSVAAPVRANAPHPIAIQQPDRCPILRSNARMRSAPRAVLPSTSGCSAQLRSARGFNALFRAAQRATLNTPKNSASTIRCGPYPPVDEGNIRHIYSEEDFERELEAAGDKLIVIDISNRFCGPCKIVYPYVVELSEELTDVCFLRLVGDHSVDTKALLTKWRVCATPNFHFYHKGQKIFSFLGGNPQKLRTHLNRITKKCAPLPDHRPVVTHAKPDPVANFIQMPNHQTPPEPNFA